MQKYSIITYLTHYSLFFYAVTNQNNLYRECVLQINPKTYEYSVCKSSEAIPGYDVYPLTDIAYPDVIGKMHCNYQKLHEILEGYFYVC